MRFYQVHLIAEGGESAGYQWFTRQREAQAAITHWTKDKSVEHDADMKLVDIKPTKAGILAALNRYADHADNG